MTELIKPPPLQIGDITVPIPIIQGGMGVGISLAGLASAVARNGCIGVISSAMIGIVEEDFYKNPQGSSIRAIERQIRLAKENAPGGIIGINIMVALENYDKQVQAATRAGVDLIISGAGLPLRLPSYVPEGSNVKLVPIVSSGRAANLLCRRWKELYNRLPDAIVVEGPEAGGHLGFKAEDLTKPENTIENLIVDVLDATSDFRTKYNTRIPVIAAGGIFGGEEMYRIMKMGADGVQMATRFVATHECDAAMEFKMAYVNAKKEDVEIVISPVGLPGRAIRNKFLEDVKQGLKRPKICRNKCLKTCDYRTTAYCISEALINAQKGDIDNGLVFCGSNVWRVDRIVSVKELIDTILLEYHNAAIKDMGRG